MRRGRPFLVSTAALAVTCIAAGTAFCADFGMPLVRHAETRDGKVLDSRDADRAVNPASVVKLVTSLRALETLGSQHRFVTTFGAAGKLEAGTATALVVEGGADPDFHFENAMLVARTLNDAGLRKVRGDVWIGPTFWMGWERGTAGREPDAAKRRTDMGRRLLSAWSPSSWNAEQKQSWNALAARRGWAAGSPPSIAVDGRVRIDGAPASTPLAVHRSQPLLVALRRFNVFSQNDIERLDASTGPAPTMAAWLAKRWGDGAANTSFSTSSGLNRNRMTPKQVVRLLRELEAWLAQHGHTPPELMPVLGCGDSTLHHLFLQLRASGEANGLAGKTGTLGIEDGGVSALAGFLPAGQGVVFFVAAPGSGKALWPARRAQEQWVRSILEKTGPVGPLTCPPPVPISDELAIVEAPGASRNVSKIPQNPGDFAANRP
jgi:D-alanyl-D-alanine carboxypeptidase/D-alanyl-D-alanine-endopeptidase (penicillin-binding protein 4)